MSDLDVVASGHAGSRTRYAGPVAPRGGYPRVRAVVDAVVEIKFPSFEPPDSLLRMVARFGPVDDLLVAISDSLYTETVGAPRVGVAHLGALRRELVGRSISFRAVPIITRSSRPIYRAIELYFDREPELPVPFGEQFPPGKWVYFVGPMDRSVVKIGTTWTVYERVVKQLQAQSVIPLALFAVKPGDREVEQAFHARFAAYHSRGEIFNVAGDLGDWLDREGLAQPIQLLQPGRSISVDQNPPRLAEQLAQSRAEVRLALRNAGMLD